MPKSKQINHARPLFEEVKWLSEIIRQRLKETAHKKDGILGINEFDPTQAYSTTPQATAFPLILHIPAPDLSDQQSTYAQFVAQYELNLLERLLLATCFANHLMPSMLTHHLMDTRTMLPLRPEFGGVQGANFRYLVPTGLTFLFVAGGYNLPDRFIAQQLFVRRHLFSVENIVSLEPHFKGDPSLSGRLSISENWLDYFMFGSFDPADGSIKYGNTEDAD